MKALHQVGFLLLLIGGLNWGIYALTGWEIGQLFGGMDATISKVIYVLVGLSAVSEIVGHKMNCKVCSAK
jgi:uncharacterized protein